MDAIRGSVAGIPLEKTLKGVSLWQITQTKGWSAGMTIFLALFAAQSGSTVGTREYPAPGVIKLSSARNVLQKNMA